MSLSQPKSDEPRGRRREWLLLLLVLLLSFTCIFSSAWFAVSRPPSRLASAAMSAGRQADYGELPGESARFAPLDPNIIAEAATDAAWLQITQSASAEDDASIAIVSLPPTPTPSATPTSASLPGATVAPGTASATPPTARGSATPAPSGSPLPTGTVSAGSVTATSTGAATGTPMVTATSTPIPTATPFYTPTPTATSTRVPPSPTVTSTPIPPTPTDAPEPPPTPTATNTPTPVNAPPLAVDDAAVTDEDVVMAVNVVANDTDPDGNLDPASVTTVTSPLSGTLTIAATGRVTYTPYLNINGIDIFEYQVCDTGAPILCDTATVTMTVSPVNDPPVAVDDPVMLDSYQPVAIDVPANDTDVDGNLDVTSVTTVTNPLSGTLSLGLTGLVTYTRNMGARGADTFVYQVCDTGLPMLCDTATVTTSLNNLALNKPTEVSSHHSNLTGDKAVDGDLDTFWRTANGSSLPSEAITITLSSTTPITISQVVLGWHSSHYATSYTIQVSLDGITWTTVYSTLIGDGGTDAINFGAIPTRYVKMESTAWSSSTSWRCGLREFEVYP